jgi:hypothetical protein
VPRTYSSKDKIRAELAWVNETPDPNKCGCPECSMPDKFDSLWSDKKVINYGDPASNNGTNTQGVTMKLHPLIRIGLIALIVLTAFVAGQQYSRPVAAQSHQKWEYEIVGSSFAGSGQVDKLNKLGEEGWEVVTLNASNRVLLRRAK